MDIDKTFLFSCPDECGQVAVPCSIRMILENQTFFCDSCGCEFQGTVFPTWLSTASHMRLSSSDTQICNNMQALYAYLYAGGNIPSSAFIEKLLTEHTKYWQLFPVNKIPLNVIIKLLSSDAELASTFDFASLDSANWVSLLTKAPNYAAKCPWNTFSRYVVEGNNTLPATFLRKREAIFTNSGLDSDKRFSATATQEKYELASPIVFAQKMGWEKHLNWDAFSNDDIFAAFQVAPSLLGVYTFTTSNVSLFDWNKLKQSNLESVINTVPSKSPLLKIYSLRAGRNVENILKENPDWEQYCAWDKISAKEWLLMIIESPKWENHCPWHIFNTLEWLSILKRKPEYAAHCPWDIFSFNDWKQIFKLDINYAKHCNWDNFNSSNWVEIIKAYPELARHCNLSTINTSDWIELFKLDKNYQAKCTRWNAFRADDWIELFKLDTSLEEKCTDWNIFSSSQWGTLLVNNPELAKHCDWKKIHQDDWKKILLNDTINDAKINAQLVTTKKISFKYANQRHPEYLAIYNLLHSTDIANALNLYPELENKYLQWDSVKGEEWLACLATKESYASKCKTMHWQKMLDFIKTLPQKQQLSVKNFNEKLWEKRLAILDAADCTEITKLTSEDFYTLIDFMDWEWDKHFSWESVNKNQVLYLAQKHPEILEKYGFEKVSNQDITKIFTKSALFAEYCLEKSRGNDATAQTFQKLLNHDTIAALLIAHPELYPTFKPYFKLNLKDRILFKYYGIKELRHKVAFYRIFITQIVIFILFWWRQLYGECGFHAFKAEYPHEAKIAMYVYFAYALLWSVIQAKLHEHCGKNILSRFIGITQGMLGFMFFNYSFFLTNMTRPKYLTAIAIYAVYMLIMLCRHHHCSKQLTINN